MHFFKKIITKLLSLFIRLLNYLSNLFYRKRNKNYNFTIISRDCVGGFIYNQLRMRFLTPTINLFLTQSDFIFFCLHLKDYLAGTIVEVYDEKVSYPVGLLSPAKESLIKRIIRIDFMHYDSFSEAFKKWEERKQRINWNNIYVVSSFCYETETKTFSEQLIADWNCIDYKKVILVDKKYGFENEYVINKPSACYEHAWLLFSPKKSTPWKKTFNNFDFISFLNGDKKNYKQKS